MFFNFIRVTFFIRKLTYTLDFLSFSSFFFSFFFFFFFFFFSLSSLEYKDFVYLAKYSCLTMLSPPM